MIKKFFINLFIFCSILFLILGGYLFLIYHHPDFVDEAYYKFTTPRANSLIIGTSRAAVGLVPNVINKRLFGGEKRIINHSFTFGTSNYGPRYLREIKHKILSNQEHNGVFIISVDPWSLSINKEDKDDTNSFVEVKNNVFVGGLNSSSVNPNIEYLRKYWSNRLYPLEIIVKKAVNHEGLWILREDGWMDVDVPCDSITVQHRIAHGLADYKRNHMKLSEARFNYLEQIIQFLKQEGAVYLVRMPVTNEMKDLEFLEFPQFDAKVNEVAGKRNVRYLNFINSEDYKFVDVHHMQKLSAFKLSEQICDSVLELKRLSIN